MQGSTGVGNILNTFYNVSNRYQANGTSGAEVWIHSSSNVYLDIPWSRSGTTLTITRSGHGHTTGDIVIVRNANIDYIATPIISTTPTTFSINVVSSGNMSGSSAYYSLGFSFVHSVTLTGGNVIAPSGAEVQLISMRLRTGQRSGTTYDLTVPNSVINGAGANTNLGNVFIPNFGVRTDSDTLAAVAGTIGVNQNGLGYSTFTFGNLGSGTLSRFILLHF